jgi:hypothetical protein
MRIFRDDLLVAGFAFGELRDGGAILELQVIAFVKGSRLAASVFAQGNPPAARRARWVSGS